MVWYVWALFSAVFDAAYYLLIKRLLKDINKYILASGVYFTAGVMLLLVSLVNGLPAIGDLFYTALLTSVVINIVATILIFRAFQLTDISLAMPMISFTPVLTIITSFVLLSEFPTLLGIGGILLIVIGSYVLNITQDRHRFLDPLRSIAHNRGAMYMLIVAFLFSIALNFDKIVVLNSDPFFGGGAASLMLGTSFLLISVAKKLPVVQTYQLHVKKFVLTAVVFSLIAITVYTALGLQIVPYVVSIKRLSILFSVIGGGLLFKEKNMIHRIIGAFIMLAGMIVIIMF